VVKVHFRPGNLKTFDDSIMVVQKFPSGSNGAPGGRADDGEANDTIGVRDKGDVVAQVVAGIVFGAGKYQRSETTANFFSGAENATCNVPEKNSILFVRKEIFALIPSLLADDSKQLLIESSMALIPTGFLPLT
jgi:hypothetical protein